MAWALPLILLLAAATPKGAAFTLKGTVVDATQAPIPSARVSAVPSAGGPERVVGTDMAGTFALDLTPGAYTVTAVASGFSPQVEAVKAPAGGSDTRKFILVIAGFGESVEVSSPDDYHVSTITSAMRTDTPLRDVPQSVTVTTRQLIRDQMMLSMGDVVRYTPGIQVHQGENNRDQVVIRGNSSSADFFVNGVRDDVQYYRDLYNVERVEAIKGPNATMFGRGGGGGVVNRVTKEAGFERSREVTVQGGGYGHLRGAVDLDEPLSNRVALRLNGMYEGSDSFRKDVSLDRWALNPTLTFDPGPRTRFTLAYEHLHDARVADRGITSFQGKPADVAIDTFYGNPADSHVRAGVDLATLGFSHTAGSLTVRNRTMFGAYDRFYQNYVPGAVSADQAKVTLTAYNNATQRENVFSQTDLVWKAKTGSVQHTLLGGFEVGRQATDNFRNTGYFDNKATSFLAPYDAPTISAPVVTYRQSATDADNHLKTNVGALYVQDQVELSKSLQLVGGLRLDRFDLTYHNNRNGDTLTRVDNLTSPRAALVYKPIVPVSLYGSYTVSWLPSSGDQFSSLTVITEQVEPEKFTSYEMGAKWEPRGDLQVTAAVYRLDRTNTRSTDPNDPTRIVQTGSQRTDGVELGVAGRVMSRWRIAGGYAHQDAAVISATVAAREGAVVAQVPRHTFSLWNDVQVTRRLDVAAGIVHRSDMFATIDNTVTLPGYTRVDMAAFFEVRSNVRLQANLENAFDRAYWTNADSNTNLSPGYPRTLRVALTTRF